eukprot:scaffold43207_cov221-Amphora_coffeaeformis.AAC.1
MISFVSSCTTSSSHHTVTRFIRRQWRNSAVGFVVFLVIVGTTWNTLRLHSTVIADLLADTDSTSAALILKEQGLLWTAPVEHMAKSLVLQELAQKTPLPLPLQPPFRIIELGRRRTGSTFQDKRVGDSYKDFEESFVVKSHRFREKRLGDLQKEGKLVVFTSGMREDEDEILSYALYNQKPENLHKCSLCEVDHYRDLFGLTDQQ